MSCLLTDDIELGRVPATSLVLTRDHCIARLQFSRDYVNSNADGWDRVFFTDESRFTLYSFDRCPRMIRYPNERYSQCNIRETTSYGRGSIMVWGGISLEFQAINNGALTMPSPFLVVNVNGKRPSTETSTGSGQKKSLLNTGHARVRTSDGDPVVAEKKNPEFLEPHTFAPQDLLALLRNLENEICICEISLKDENDKQNKYRVDDCRRTHNYDEFVCTFLSMLAEQGKLAELVEQHLLVPKRPGNVPAPKASKSSKKQESSSSRKKRGRSKVKRRK